jgi:anthranilate synthase component 1
MVPSLARFRDLARAGNVVPVWQDTLLDLDTPVSAYLKLTGEGGAASPYGGARGVRERGGFLLESVEGGEKWATYSFLGAAPRNRIVVRGGDVTFEQDGDVVRTAHAHDPLLVIEEHLSARRAAGTEGLPRFFGGAVGYLGYDMVRRWERLPASKPDTLDVPDAILWVPETLVVFDNLKHRARVIALAELEGPSGAIDPDAAWRDACARIESTMAALRAPLPFRTASAPHESLSLRSNFERADFEAAVLRAKEYVRAGDIIQVVLSQRFEADAPDVHPFDVYRALRSLNPSPYMFYLRFPELVLTGASPEVLVRVEDGTVETRPIAGTRRRGATAEEDARLEAELRADPKELAEHIMLVDLGRNDLGRVCRVGSVTVPERLVVERYSHVMHLVSGVRGALAEGKSAFDALRATFPAGTLSGAPKIRAMEIIEELEPSRRGPYGGAIGYLGLGGNLDLCIAIRALLAKGGRFFVQAGAGLVADSVPSREFDETVNKARAVVRAVELARDGL